MNEQTNRKRCRSCWEKGHIGWHSLTDFPKSNTSRDGLSGTCKRCTAERKKKRHDPDLQAQAKLKQEIQSKRLEDPIAYQAELLEKHREDSRESYHQKMQDPENRKKYNQRRREYHKKRYAEDPGYRAKIAGYNRGYAPKSHTDSVQKQLNTTIPVSQDECDIARYKILSESTSLPEQVRLRYKKLAEDPDYREQERQFWERRSRSQNTG